MVVIKMIINIFTKISLAILLLNTPFFTGCAQQDEKKFAERAEAEGRGANKADQDVLSEKAREMEADLTERQYFYGAIEGQYQGTTQVGDLTFNIKFTFARSVPPYFGSRVRQLSEIETDLNNLSFYVQVVQWHPDDMTSAVGCRVSQIRPNMLTGEIKISSTDCPNLYTVLLKDLTDDSSRLPQENAKNISKKLRDHEINRVDFLVGSIEPTSNASVFQFSVKKVNP